jgi:hypothetical protein
MITIRAGQIIGRDHMARQVNSQDSYTVLQTERFAAAIVCDGCGEGRRSEVGAALASEFLAELALALLNEGQPISALPDLLYGGALGFLRGLLKLARPSHPVRFIHDHLLFTVLGIITDGEAGVIFAAGDGLIAIDEQVTRRDENNRPSYLAYHLLEGCDIPMGFDVVSLPPGWTRAAIASDGFEPELLPQVWGVTHGRGLQRKLNAWSNLERRFRDDATLITLERTRSDAGHDRQQTGETE